MTLPNRRIQGRPSNPIFGLAGILIILVWLAFFPAIQCGFVNFDDPDTVYESAEVTRGLSVHGIIWAFSHTVLGHWDPLTTISHMADCQFFGLHAWAHHFGNVLLHTFTGVLLFLFLAQITGTPARAFWAVALFAIHPLRVESIAWVTERKDALSGALFALLLWIYWRYLRRPQSPWRYTAGVATFAATLLAKSMVVTAPLILLLLDWLAFGRFAKPPGELDAITVRIPALRRLPTALQLLLEKLPFFGLSIVAAVVQMLAASSMSAPLSPWARAANAFTSYIAYLGQTIWPVQLSAYYEYAGAVPVLQVVGSLVGLLAISAVAVRFRRAEPYILLGWLWYVIMLLPVIGFVQSGLQTRADRYTYLPSIGLAIALVWGFADLVQRYKKGARTAAVLAGATIAACLFATRSQIRVWKDSESLFSHAVSLNPDNIFARHNLGVALEKSGRLPAAIEQYQQVAQRTPDIAEAHFALARARLQIQDVKGAIAEFQAGLALQPGDAKGHFSLGFALLTAGMADAAATQFQETLRLEPNFIEAYNHLGAAYRLLGRWNEAIAAYRKALLIQPDFFEARNNLAIALAQSGSFDAAVDEFKAVLKQQPALADTHRNLALVLDVGGHAPEAVAEYRAALALNPKDAAAQKGLDQLLLNRGAQPAAKP